MIPNEDFSGPFRPRWAALETGARVPYTTGVNEGRLLRGIALGPRVVGVIDPLDLGALALCTPNEDFSGPCRPRWLP
jgi:hypothetical protein